MDDVCDVQSWWPWLITSAVADLDEVLEGGSIFGDWEEERQWQREVLSVAWVG